MRTAKTGLGGLRPSDKVAKALLVETRMAGNPAFPTPEPALAQLKKARETLEIAMGEAAFNDHAKLAERDKAVRELDQLLTRLCLYVSNTANGDVIAILSSGFDVRRENTPVGPLPAPAALRATTGAHAGEVDLRWRPVHGAYYYQVYCSTTDPSDGTTPWASLDLTSGANLRVRGLKPGMHHWFRVSALGAAGYTSPYSDPAKGFAAPLP